MKAFLFLILCFFLCFGKFGGAMDESVVVCLNAARCSCRREGGREGGRSRSRLRTASLATQRNITYLQSYRGLGTNPRNAAMKVQTSIVDCDTCSCGTGCLKPRAA